MVVLWLLGRRPVGGSWLGLRHSERAVAALGVSVARAKITVVRAERLPRRHGRRPPRRAERDHHRRLVPLHASARGLRGRDHGRRALSRGSGGGGDLRHLRARAPTPARRERGLRQHRVRPRHDRRAGRRRRDGRGLARDVPQARGAARGRAADHDAGRRRREHPGAPAGGRRALRAAALGAHGPLRQRHRAGRCGPRGRARDGARAHRPQRGGQVDARRRGDRVHPRIRGRDRPRRPEDRRPLGDPPRACGHPAHLPAGARHPDAHRAAVHRAVGAPPDGARGGRRPHGLPRRAAARTHAGRRRGRHAADRRGRRRPRCTPADPAARRARRRPGHGGVAPAGRAPAGDPRALRLLGAPHRPRHGAREDSVLGHHRAGLRARHRVRGHGGGLRPHRRRRRLPGCGGGEPLSDA